MQPNIEIYQKNLNALRGRNPELADHLQKLDASAYQLATTQSGDPCLQITKVPTGETVSADNAPDPRAHARSLLPKVPKRNNLFLLMGMGLGYLFLEAAQKFPQSRILVIESDARIFKKALECFDFTPYFASKQYEFFVSIKFELLSHYFLRGYLTQNDNYMAIATVELLSDPRNIKLAEHYYKRAGQIFAHAVSEFWNKLVGNDYLDTLQGLDQTLINARHFGHMGALEACRDVYKDRIGIVVSSGPSLESKLPYLKSIQDRAVILAADSALRKLLAYGIKPLGVASIERTASIAGLYTGYDIPKDILLIAPPLLFPDVFDNFPGPVLTFYRNCFPFSWLPPLLDRLDAGLTCAHLNFRALTIFGCKEIAFVGQDLAYNRKTGSSYYEGMYKYAVDVMQELDRVETQDNNDGLIITNEYWLMYRNMFTEMLAIYHAGKPAYNVIEKENGVFIQGTQRIDPQDYFTRFANETPLPPLPLEKSQTFLNTRLPAFKDALKVTLTHTLEQVRGMREKLMQVATAKNFDEYLKIRNDWRSSLEPATSFLVEEALKPCAKRFEANAFGLWSQEEFDSHKIGFAEQQTKIFDDLVGILTRNQPK